MTPLRFAHSPRLAPRRLRRTAALLLALASIALAGAAEWRAQSHDRAVEITLSLNDAGAPRYRITHDGKPVVLESPLGFQTAGSGSLLDGFEVVDARETSERSEWTPVYGDRARITDRYHERTVALRHRASGIRIDLVARAYDEGAALRYVFPAQPAAAPLRIVAEQTEFRFPTDTIGYEEHGPEGEYHRGPVSAFKPNCERPLTLEYADGRFACLVEAALDRYPRMLLSPAKGTPGALVSALSGPATIDLAKGFPGPWRAFIVGHRPGDLLERNTLVLNLNPPCALADTSWIKPGKAIREVTLSTPGGKACVDFAVAHNIRYILYDAGWYGREADDASDARHVSLDPDRVKPNSGHPGLDLQAVLAYAKERGIGVFLYVNRRALERQMDEIFPLYAKWGVVGVKFGFVNVGPQEWTTWVHEGVRKAAQHRLMVDIHDLYRPTGFSRTYPNLLTQEGVRGNEHMPTATHNATLPFVRLPAGAADYTICIYTNRLKTTRAHQLALAVTGYSPLQLVYWYDRPAHFDGAPELAFLDTVPTVWDETRVLEDRIGELAVIARRSGDDWFLGAITGDAGGGREFSLPLTFLPRRQSYTAKIFENDPANPRATRIRTETVSVSDTLSGKLPPAGGQAVWITPRRSAAR